MNVFRTLYPKIDLQLHTSNDVVELNVTGVDIAIRYGAGPYSGFAVTPLFADRFAPVFNPILGIGGSKGRVDQPLSDLPLIDFEWRRHPDNPTWSCWFAAAGLPEPGDPPLLRFSKESHAIQAAVAGQGVALVSFPLVRDLLAAGQLVQASGPTIPGFRHHLLTKEDETRAAVLTVARWLHAQSREQA